MSSDHAILIDGLTRRFKDKIAVDNISLEVKPGEIYGFLGPNGAGKSTTTLILTTLLQPSAGRAFVGGFDVVRQAAQVRRRIGVALQSIALDPMLTGHEHLLLQGALYGLPAAARRQRAAALLERVGLTDAAGRKIAAYSGGMQRRLDLALALLHEPDILFLDEPTTGLDPQSRQTLWREVARLSRQAGVTVFLSTQYLEEADVLADRVAIIDRGRIVAEDTPGNLKATLGQQTLHITPADPAHLAPLQAVLDRFGRSAVTGAAVAVQLPHGAGELPAVIRALDEQAITPAALRLHEPTLDDVFLAYTGALPEGANGSGAMLAVGP